MKTFFFSVLFLCSISLANAQETAKESTPAADLQQQFSTLKSTSNTFQEHKVIRITKLDAFWKNVQDTFKSSQKSLVQDKEIAEKNLAEAQSTIAAQKQEIAALQQDNAQKQQELEKTAHNIASISVLGIDMPKQFYVILNMGIIITLLVVLAAFLSMYKNGKKVTDEKQRAFQEIDSEYNEYKKTAREKELKLKREMQTEMNRIEELNQEIALLKKQVHA